MQCSFLRAASAWFVCAAAGVAHAADVLYEQNFESPIGYNNDGGDVNIGRQINQLYGDQPLGFRFAQNYTVETLNISGSARGAGSAAFGDGFSDPSGLGGDFAIGMLSRRQDDRLGLSFDVGQFRYLNVSVDISSIDLSTFSGPFTQDNASVPVFRFTLFDNPGGALSIGSGKVLDSADATGKASPRSVFDWSSFVLALDATEVTNGKVILQVDLLEGEYAALDNLRIVAADKEGDLGGLEGYSVGAGD